MTNNFPSIDNTLVIYASDNGRGPPSPRPECIGRRRVGRNPDWSPLVPWILRSPWRTIPEADECGTRGSALLQARPGRRSFDWDWVWRARCFVVAGISLGDGCSRGIGCGVSPQAAPAAIPGSPHRAESGTSRA